MSADLQLERDTELSAFVTEITRELGTPGAGVGVLADGRALVAPFGVTSTTDPLAVDEHTLFMIGSTSKTFTATAVMALVDQGAIGLKDRVIDHLHHFRLQDERVAQTVTIEQLLNHTGGWRGDVHPATGWGEGALEEALAEVASSPQLLPPGEVASYSNSGFLIAGHLLATLFGSSFEQAVRELVIDPLGLHDTWYLPWEIANRRHAVGHVVQDGHATPVLPYPMQRSTGPAGGLWSSVRDQLSYARYHLDGTTPGTAPLREETRLLMQQPTVTARSTIDGIGLSWLLKHYGDVRLITHGGNVSNLQTSTFAVAPDHGVAVTVMTNAKHGPEIGAKVLAWVLDRWMGIPPQTALPTEEFEPAELEGVYDLGPFAWQLTATDGKLFVDTKVPDEVPEKIRIAFSGPPKELVAVGQDVFALAADPAVPALDVRRAADGSIDGIVHGMRFAPRVP